MCTFNVIYKDNAAINGITVKKNSFIPVNFYGSYAIVITIKVTTCLTRSLTAAQNEPTAENKFTSKSVLSNNLKSRLTKSVMPRKGRL